MTPAQRHAIQILEIQDAKRGWASMPILTACGVSLVTLKCLERQNLVERKEEAWWCFRLTARGEQEAKRLKRLARMRAKRAKAKEAA